MVTLIKLKYFVDVAELHSFTKAAKHNHVAQTSISQQIKELEENYQVKLINRDTSPISLTTAGQILYQHSLNILSDVNSLNKAMEQYNSKFIRIAYSSMQDLQLIDHIFSAFPTLKDKLIVEREQMRDIAPNLEQGKIDFAITFDSEFFDTPNIETITLKQGNYLAGMRKDHPLGNRDEITLDQLYSYPLVMIRPESIGKSFEIMFDRSREVGQKPDVEVLTDNVESELFMIEHRNLIGFFPEDYPINRENDNLKLVLISNSPHVYKIVLAYDRRKLKDNKLIKQIERNIAHR